MRPRLPASELRKLPVPPLVAQVLHGRGITTQAELDAFLAAGAGPLTDPLRLSGMGPAAARVRRALAANETIGVFGDFDVDGVAGTALLARTLERLGARVVPYLPHRIHEGHGLNPEAVRILVARGVTLLVTVDCGVTSGAEVALARELGMDVVITDHHAPPPQLPPALAIVDPRLEGAGAAGAELSGAGLALKLAQALQEEPRATPDGALLQLAALGAIADVAPLTGENRVLVKEGLRALHAQPLPGLEALLRCAGVEPRSVDVEAVSFIVAPRLNAAGRLEHASTAYTLLTAASAEAATAPAETLEGLNRERQRLTEECHALARERVLSWEPLPSLLLVAEESFTPGVSGLVASRLVEEFYRPAVVVALEEVARASARSIGEFNIIAALARCADLFISYGGHPQAAGFVMERERLPALRQRLVALAEEALAGLELQPDLAIDAHVSLRSLNREALQWLRALEPYGPGNPAPVFLARNVAVVRPHTMGEDGEHLRFALREGNVVWEAVAFRQGDRLPVEGARLHIVFTLGMDWWHGAEVLSLRVLDFRPSP